MCVRHREAFYLPFVLWVSLKQAENTGSKNQPKRGDTFTVATSEWMADRNFERLSQSSRFGAVHADSSQSVEAAGWSCQETKNPTTCDWAAPRSFLARSENVSFSARAAPCA